MVGFTGAGHSNSALILQLMDDVSSVNTRELLNRLNDVKSFA